MFDKFGEFDSVEELNNAAAGQLALIYVISIGHTM